LGAQALYFGGPFLRPVLKDVQRDALADLLEDRQEALAFAAFLREKNTL
jgi:isopentenyl diphosphate isomerase/L-lactate dehydrogenase-like FMN-dependent dehydrogenase